MGLSSDIPNYAICGALIGFGICDGYRWTSHKVSKAYDYLEDTLDSTTGFLSSTADEVLYQTGLSPTSHIPRTFLKFINLPAEIRLRIWELAIPGQRVIELRHNDPKKSIRSKTAFPGLTSTCQIPPLLHACRESREEALKFYELSFATNDLPAKVYIDFSRDIVYFGAKSNFYGIQHLTNKTTLPRGKDKLRFFGPPNEFFNSSPPSTIPEKLPTQGFERIKFMALRSKGYEDTERFDYGVFKSVEEVVLVGEKKFALGPEPCLETRELEEDGLNIYPSVFHHAVDMQRKVMRTPGSKAPVVRKGAFLKGCGDRWYCEERGRAKFG